MVTVTATDVSTLPRRSLAAPELVRAGLMSVGAAQPVTSFEAAELAAPFGRTGEWVEQRTGIRQLSRLAPGETLADLALRAARDAVGGSTGPLDLVIAASCSVRSDAEPLAPFLAAHLAPRAATIDLNAACAGFCYSLGVAQAAIATGSANRVLIVGAEQMSRLLDPADLGTSIIFGDGAGAAVVSALPDGADVAIGPVVWGSDGSGAEVIDMPGDGAYLRMQGQAVFRWAVDEMHHVATEACRRAGVGVEDIEVFVPHQANVRIVEAMAKRIGVAGTVARSVCTTGNTSAASIPLALTQLLADPAHRGRLALLIGFGAGLAYAGQVIRLPGGLTSL